jgi:lysophospholipase L1-like esterase
MDAARSPWMRLRSGALSALTLSLLLVSACASASTAAPATFRLRPTLSVAVMGASDAWGVGTHDPDRLNWPTLLGADLPPSTHVINLGEPGATLAQARRSELPVVLGERPDVAVLWLAVNDIITNVPLNTYSTELSQTLAAIHERSPQTRIFVGNVPDLTQLPYFSNWGRAALMAEVGAWNTAIAQACATIGATLVDIHRAWGQSGEHPDYVSDDGLHPSDQGAAALASVFSEAIAQSLRRTR